VNWTFVKTLAASDGGLTLQRPQFMFGLLIPIAFAAWIWLRQGRRLALPFDYGSRRERRTLRWMVTIMETLVPAVFCVAIIIFCIPLATGSPVNQRKLSNIEFCVDCSGSMTARFGDGDRYDASMAAINEFLGYREGDAFGLTFFATDVVRWCPLTKDSSAFRCAIPFMKPDAQRAIGGGTMIGRALRYCKKVLRDQEEGDRMIILVSDGMSADLSNGADLEIAKELLREGVVVYGIHIGGGAIPAEVTNLTTATGGEAFVSGDPEGLQAVFRRIDQMEPAEVEFIGIEYVEYFEPFCWVGLSLLGLWVVGAFGVRYTPW
jgi:Ca-activated chloride channel family protein